MEDEAKAVEDLAKLEADITEEQAKAREDAAKDQDDLAEDLAEAAEDAQEEEDRSGHDREAPVDEDRRDAGSKHRDQRGTRCHAKAGVGEAGDRPGAAAPL